MKRIRNILATLILAACIGNVGDAAVENGKNAAVVQGKAGEPTGLLRQALGPGGAMEGVGALVLATRRVNETDPHWYANIGYYAHDADRKAWREGGRLCRWEPATGKVSTIFEDTRGGIRDPQVHYEGKRILFSYRPGGTEQYHLYEIGIDGKGLRQLTTGAYDDFEPTYMPDDSIIFVSTRCKRWVNCWLTQVAVLYRCSADGSDVHPISSNNEQDNTPWPMPDGRVLYTRWEYVDRSQVDYHHLWAGNPDGTAQTVWFGNMHPKTVMIDAKPIPGSDLVISIFSPGHGAREHAGLLTIVDPKAGPDNKASARTIGKGANFRDPWAFSKDCIIAAQGPALVLFNGEGKQQEVFRLSQEEIRAGFLVHEPRPLVQRPREGRIPPRVKRSEESGRLVLANIYDGRNMGGVNRGEVKKLLVLETLPMPIHYTGGMEPISYGGTFTLERIVGTVPVEEDGSAYFELPALRSFFLVALDKDDLAIKRMQSFLTVQPGEVTSCLGCHEQRTRTPTAADYRLLATRRPASKIAPVEDVPDVIDFPRDIQPILNALCVDCHGYEKTEKGGPRSGRLILSGAHGPMYSHSYYMLTIAKLFSDGRNQAVSNYAPRTLGSAASRILKMLDGTHNGVRATPLQKKMIRLWIESGAAYPGTYAALGSGMIGSYAENQAAATDYGWATTKAGAEVINRRCVSCHQSRERLLPRALSDERGVSFWRPDWNDPRLLTSRHIVFNLTEPKKSIMLMAPLAKESGGWGLCKDPKGGGKAAVFGSDEDPDYKRLLAMIEAGRERLRETKRFDMPGFEPRSDWVREMKRYGIIPVEAKGPFDPYALERRYWESLWHRPIDSGAREVK